ncbi:hypothetical protein [Streptomyces sp. NPDC007905]|uniref:hypothetical protein n=1 Tax=Streptomyces sp. NPDC007905 TaxID=3364788 RepID=UPI0036EF0C9F
MEGDFDDVRGTAPGRGRRGVRRARRRPARIARLGAGTVESYPQDTEGGSVSASFLYNGTLARFESRGFSRARRLGKNHWVVTCGVRPSA